MPAPLFAPQTVQMRLVGVILAVALPLAAVMLSIWWQSLQEGRALQLSLLRANVLQLERQLASLLADSKWMMAGMAARPTFRGLSPGACSSEGARLLEVHPAFRVLTLWTKDGALVCSSAPPGGQPSPEPHRATFDEGLAASGPYLSNLLDEPTGLPLVAVTHPVLGDAGEPIGLLWVPLRLAHLEQWLGELQVPEGSAAGIIDRNLRFVARAPDNASWQGRSIEGVPRLEQALRAEEGIFETTADDGTPRFVGHRLVAGTGWRVFVRVDNTVLFGAFRKQLVQGTAAFVGVIAISLLLAHAIGRGISGPVEELVAVASSVAAGNHGRRAQVSGGGEIQSLAQRLNEMLDSLAESRESLKKSHLEIAESEDRYRRMAEASPDAIMIHQDLRIVLVNQAMTQLMGAASAADLVGKSLDSIVSPEHVEAARAHSLALYAGTPQVRAERVYRRLDGTLVPVEIASAPLLLDGRPAGEVTVRDITRRKESEKSLLESVARTREIARRLVDIEEAERRRINHELHDRLGQDLAAAKLTMELIGSQLPPEIAHRASGRLTEVNRLLQSSIDHARNIMAELRPPSLDDGGLVAALRIHAETVSARLSIPVRVAGMDLEPRLRRSDETALFRIAQEALGNVGKHSRARAVGISVSQQGAELVLEISDDGVGFDTAQAATGRHGLETMRERAEAMGAKLEIDSAPGRGTRILVRLERA